MTARRRAKIRGENSGEKLHAYPCKFCRHWHIGHRSYIKTPRNPSTVDR